MTCNISLSAHAQMALSQRFRKSEILLDTGLAGQMETQLWTFLHTLAETNLAGDCQQTTATQKR